MGAETNSYNGASIESGLYSIVYTWVSKFGETRPSISLNGSEGRSFISVGSGQAIVFTLDGNENVPMMGLPPGAIGTRIYARKSTDPGLFHRRVRVKVLRNGSVQEVDTIKLEDKYPYTKGFIISNISTFDPEDESLYVYPPKKNTTGAVSARPPQVSKLRVIATDEV